jgi:GTP-binding protein
MDKDMHKPKNAEFLRGVRGIDKILNYREPQIAFIGRSNVGKSSTINAIVGNSKLARSSGTPGKTQEMNFFLVNQAYLFVDFPGYGYAKMPKAHADKLRKMILWYFTSGEGKPRLVVVVIDAQAGLTQYDEEMLSILRENGHPHIVVANKIDRLNQKERSSTIRTLTKQLPGADLIPFSAKEGTGVEMLRSIIFSR